MSIEISEYRHTCPRDKHGNDPRPDKTEVYSRGGREWHILGEGTGRAPINFCPWCGEKLVKETP